MTRNTTFKVSFQKARRQGAGFRRVKPKGTPAGVNIESHWEELLLLHIRAEKLPPPRRQFLFHSDREWAFDFAWPDQRLAVEVDGAVYSQGRHTRGQGFEEDLVKLNEALLLGWTVPRFSGGQVKSGYAIDTLQRFFQRLKNQEA